MKCVQCDHEGLQATTTNHDVRIGDRKIQVAVAATKCPKCSEVYVNGGTMERAEMLVAEHVARSGAVSGETFRFMRKALGLQAKALGALIGTPAETISRWETEARGTDRFAWIALAGMVIDAAEERAPITRDIARATLDPSDLPRKLQLDNAA